MDLNEAIQFAQLIDAAYAVAPADLTNSASTVTVAGGTTYTVITTIYANDLATDLDPARGADTVSIGLIFQAAGTGDVVVAIRGTEGILEWVHDAEFLQVNCPFLAGAGHTDDGFTAMYNSFRIGVSPIRRASSPHCYPPFAAGRLGGHLRSQLGRPATLLALDLAANSGIKNPTAYTYASPPRETERSSSPLTRWSRNHSVSPIGSTLCRSCPSPAVPPCGHACRSELGPAPPVPAQDPCEANHLVWARPQQLPISPVFGHWWPPDPPRHRLCPLMHESRIGVSCRGAPRRPRESVLSTALRNGPGTNRPAVGKAEVDHRRRNSTSCIAERVPHRLTCQPTCRERSGSEQPGSLAN